MGLHGQRHVVEGGELAQHRGDLEGTRQSEPHPGMRGQARDVAAGEMDGTGVGLEGAGELAHQRGLARAVGTDQGMDLAGPDIDRDRSVARRPPKRLIRRSVESSGSAMTAPEQRSMPPLA